MCALCIRRRSVLYPLRKVHSSSPCLAVCLHKWSSGGEACPKALTSERYLTLSYAPVLESYFYSHVSQIPNLITARYLIIVAATRIYISEIAMRINIQIKRVSAGLSLHAYQTSALIASQVNVQLFEGRFTPQGSLQDFE